MAAEDEDDRATVPFAQVLNTLRRGKVHRELSAELQRLTEAVIDTGRPGSITFKLTLKKSKATGMVEIADDLAVKAPAPDRPVSMFYVTDDHNLVKDDPKQTELDLGIVRIVEDNNPKEIAQ